MGWRSEVAEGWRLFLPYAREVVTPDRRRVLLAWQVGIGVLTAAGIHLVTSGLPEVFRIFVALAASVFAASVVTWIGMARWRPKISASEKWCVYTPIDPGAAKEIRAAVAAGGVPDLPDWQRDEAARRAEESRPRLARMILTMVPAGGLIVSYIMAAVVLIVSLTEHPVSFLSALWFAGFWAVRLPTHLRHLGQTTPVIASRPEGPFDPPPTKTTKPYRQLGTDHPTDYDR